MMMSNSSGPKGEWKVMTKERSCEQSSLYRVLWAAKKAKTNIEHLGREDK